MKQTLPEEMNVLLDLLNGKPAEWKEEKNDALVNLVGHHRLFPLLQRKTAHLNLTQKFQQSLQAQIMHNTFVTLQLAGETARAADFFRTNNQRLLVLKGPALAEFLYGDVSARMTGDLDLLVPLKELDRAHSLLEELGYKENPYFSTVLSDWKWRHHHLTFYHPVSGIKLELHWRMHPGPGKEVSFEEMWKERQYISLGRSSIPIMGTEHLFAFLSIHGARHGWSRMRWICDINELINKDIDWNKVEKILGDQKHLGGLALALVKTLFHHPLPSKTSSLADSKKVFELTKATEFYLKEKIELHAEIIPEYVSRYHRAYMFSLMGTKRKLLFVSSFLYPYPEDVETLPIPKSLHFLYVPIRPFLWLWRKTKKAVTV